MIKLGLLDLIEEYQYNKTIIVNTELEMAHISSNDDIEELENRKNNLDTKINLVEKYDLSYILTETEISMIKSLHMDKPIENVYEKFQLSESNFDNWMSLIKKKLKKINIYIAQ